MTVTIHRKDGSTEVISGVDDAYQYEQLPFIDPDVTLVTVRR